MQLQRERNIKKTYMKILLIDDHELFRNGLRLALLELNDDLDIVEANSYEESHDLLQVHRNIDLILFDLGLPGLNDITAFHALRDNSPDIPVVVISANENPEKAQQLLSAGAQGYITKTSNAKIILNAIQVVMAGNVFIPAELFKTETTYPVEQLTENILHLSKILTPRQIDVLQQLAEGRPNKEIGNILGLTESTVRVHVAAILRAFKVKNRTQAVQFASRRGWIN